MKFFFFLSFLLAQAAYAQLPKDVLECVFEGPKKMKLKAIINDARQMRLVSENGIVCAPKFVSARFLGRMEDAIYIGLQFDQCVKTAQGPLAKSWLSDGNLTLRSVDGKWFGTANMFYSSNGRSASCLDLKWSRGYPEKFVKAENR